MRTNMPTVGEAPRLVKLHGAVKRPKAGSKVDTRVTGKQRACLEREKEPCSGPWPSRDGGRFVMETLKSTPLELGYDDMTILGHF